MLVAIIQPSYAKAVAQTALSSRELVLASPGRRSFAAAKLFTSMCVGLTRPTIMPTTAMSPRGISFITVVEV